MPFHKKDDIHCNDNHRRVLLLNIVSKFYTSVLNNRLYNWAEDCGKNTEPQADFKKGYSTTNNILTLYAMTQKYLVKKERNRMLFLWIYVMHSIPYNIPTC